MNAAPLIPAQSLACTNAIKAVFSQYVDTSVLDSYRLPVKSNQAKVIVGMSGGADSSVLGLFAAAYLAPHYPNLEFIFTDTGAEPESCYETLVKVESLAGIRINRIQPEKGLFELIESYNGFLPNGQARWCTRQLKIDPLTEYMNSVPSEHGHISLAGIRFDEPNRDGISFQYTMENASAAFPFIELKITRETVFKILAKTVGIPHTYAYRSRSGCYTCFFQRNQELVGMLAANPAEFAETERHEKLTDTDLARWGNVPATIRSKGINAYYPVPSFIDVRKPQKAPHKPLTPVKDKRDTNTADLFNIEPLERPDSLFVAFALYTNDGLSLFGGAEFTPGVYWQELVTISTSLNGIKASLNNYYQFKLTTPMPQYDSKDMKIVIAQIDFPPGVIDTKPPSADSFTWKKNTAFLQIRNLVTHAQNVLHRVDLERQICDYESIVKQGGDSKEYALEQLSHLTSSLHSTPTNKGELVWEGLYTPNKATEASLQLKLQGISVDSENLGKSKREGLEFDEIPTACLACSI